mmetsp:Transcript_31185/g.72382  ORF Transcript_31185/g.72382 Transcript_31185/m.72382 type:complete len:204 (-) Transcript_31185:247-858(-)
MTDPRSTRPHPSATLSSLTASCSASPLRTARRSTTRTRRRCSSTRRSRTRLGRLTSRSATRALAPSRACSTSSSARRRARWCSCTRLAQAPTRPCQSLWPQGLPQRSRTCASARPRSRFSRRIATGRSVFGRLRPRAPTPTPTCLPALARPLCGSWPWGRGCLWRTAPARWCSTMRCHARCRPRSQRTRGGSRRSVRARSSGR